MEYFEKYYIKTKWHPEKEVTKKQYMEAELVAGFWSKIDGEPATSGFGDSKSGIEGGIVYVR